MGNYMVIHVFIFNTNCHEFITNFFVHLVHLATPS